MTDGDEHASHCQIFGAAIVEFQTSAVHAFVIAQNFVQIGIQFQGDFAFFYAFHQFINHDFFSAEGFTAVYQHHVFGDIGQVQSLFNRSVATAHNRDFLVFVEETIASGTS